MKETPRNGHEMIPQEESHEKVPEVEKATWTTETPFDDNRDTAGMKSQKTGDSRQQHAIWAYFEKVTTADQTQLSKIEERSERKEMTWGARRDGSSATPTVGFSEGGS